MKDTINFIKKVISETLKESKKSMFTSVVVGIVMFIIHTFVVVVLNNGYKKSQIFLPVL